MTKVTQLQEENQNLRVELLRYKLDLIVLALTPESKRAQRIRDYWLQHAGRRGSTPAVIDCVIELSNTAGK